jgi:four helix bundle protein
MGPKYEKLRAWQVAHEVTIALFCETEGWPKREWYGLAAHLRKTAVSIGSNLAEGSAKRGVPEYRRFVDIAIGSFNEAEYQLRLGKDLGYVREGRYAALKERFAELGRCLYGLARGLDGR